jgi:hypothetical protein
VRELVIDGTKALAFSTGGGLDFTVLIDRSLDIGLLTWRGVPVGYVGPSGFAHPAGHDPHADGGRGFNRLFSGFLVTGGLEHIRQPANGHPLHGTLPFTPATLTASGVDEGKLLLFCEGEVRQPGFVLRRRIEAAIWGNTFSIVDLVENLSSEHRRQASLYHFNMGRPALADGAMVTQAGETRLGPLRIPDETIPSESVCYPVRGEHGACSVRLAHCEVRFTWEAATLPYLQLWHRLAGAHPVLSVEPCTSDRLPGGLSAEELLLNPGACRRYALSVALEGATS